MQQLKLIRIEHRTINKVGLNKLNINNLCIIVTPVRFTKIPLLDEKLYSPIRSDSDAWFIHPVRPWSLLCKYSSVKNVCSFIVLEHFGNLLSSRIKLSFKYGL